MKDCCSGVNLPSELLQDVIHLIHHLLANGPSRLNRLETLQELKGSISTAQFPEYTKPEVAQQSAMTTKMHSCFKSADKQQSV